MGRQQVCRYPKCAAYLTEWLSEGWIRCRQSPTSAVRSRQGKLVDFVLRLLWQENFSLYFEDLLIELSIEQIDTLAKQTGRSFILHAN